MLFAFGSPDTEGNAYISNVNISNEFGCFANFGAANYFYNNSCSGGIYGISQQTQRTTFNIVGNTVFRSTIMAGLILGGGSTKAHAARSVGLGIAIDEEGGDAFEGERSCQVDGGCGFTDSTLLIDDSEDFGHCGESQGSRCWRVAECSTWNMDEVGHQWSIEGGRQAMFHVEHFSEVVDRGRFPRCRGV